MVNDEKETLAALYEQNLAKIQDGQIVKGRIVHVGPREIFVDVGYKSEGIIPREEFLPHDELVVGKEVEVYVESTENDQGMIVLSREKAERLKGWDTINKNFHDNDIIEGRVKKKVKGGFLVDVFGIEGFLPLSLSAFKNMADKEILNNPFNFKIIKINSLRRSLIISRKDAMQKEREQSRQKLWQTLKVGDTVKGTVKGITDFGAFIDLGGIDGLLHIMDMSWSRIAHPSEIVAIGDKIDVVILNLDKESGKVSLGLKQRMPDPWADIETKYPVGSKVKGKVVNILAYGIFVELEKGIEGLIHISEMSWAKRTSNPSEMFAIGDTVEVKVLSIDKESRRISLSTKQLENNPWLEAETKFPVGAKVTCRITGFTEYGAFVDLDDNLEGMIHVGDISWTKRIAHPQDVLKKGQKIEAVILSVDTKARRIALGLKQLEENPWPTIAQNFPAGTTLDAEVINVTALGVFVRLQDDLEGLIFPGEIDKEQMDSLKPQDKIKVRVIKVDAQAAKISLTVRI